MAAVTCLGLTVCCHRDCPYETFTPKAQTKESATLHRDLLAQKTVPLQHFSLRELSGIHCDSKEDSGACKSHLVALLYQGEHPAGARGSEFSRAGVRCMHCTWPQVSLPAIAHLEAARSSKQEDKMQLSCEGCAFGILQLKPRRSHATFGFAYAPPAV